MFQIQHNLIGISRKWKWKYFMHMRGNIGMRRKYFLFHFLEITELFFRITELFFLSFEL